ncbi:tetratricopeptide repeat protein [Microcystis sp. LE19-55.1A]|uniref:tetratricopeptide repeat protein n=1 Tax=Microcystis sp. LE19-55.1A TaxID=3016436 RepID=UPI00258BEB17|nr:tetratricopeptide repeat protein [Microcystis sp. LE19-55.1A]
MNLLLTTAFSGFGLTGLNWWREKQQKRRRARIAGDSLPFRVVRPNQDVFPAIFGRERAEYLYPSLIDWDIPLQDRELDINHLAEIIRLLNDDQWVIITGPAGIGKTREMAEVALRFIRRGWTVMVFTGTLEGDQFPREQFLDVRRNVLFIFDDLHIQMRRSEPTRENRATEEQSLPTDRPLQERLLAALDHCDSVHIPDTRIKVLATARDETVSDDPRLVSPWEMLQWERYPLWRRFTRYRLPRPENQAAASWLVNVSNRTGIQLECPPEEIAQRNDGTFQNLVNNFEILLAGDSQEGRSLSLSRENFKDTLRGSWKKCYQDAFKLEPLAKELYDAVDLLQQANIPLKAFVVERVALMLVRGNRWQKVRYQWRIKKALEKLEAREGILSPRDGQIEGKGELLSLEDYLEKLLGLFLALLDRFPLEVKEALDKVSNKLYDKQNYTESLRGYDALVKYFPKDENFQLMRGNNLYYLVRYADALDCFNQATEIKPDYFRAWTNKGLIIQKIDVLEGVEKEATALEYYDRALAINPDDALTLVNKGLLLGELGKKEEALELYKQAINNDPNYYRAYYAQGLEFSEMNRYEESISAYAQAIEVKPDFVAAWVGKGNQLANLGRYEEALSAYEEAIRLKPDDEAAWLNKGNQLANLGRYEEALSAYQEAIRLKPDYEAAWHNKGNQLANLGRYEEALSAYEEAIRLKPDYDYAWNGKGNQLANLGRYEEALSAYEEAIRLKPDYEAAWLNKGNQLANLGRYEEALSAYEEAIRLKPDYEAAWLGKGNQLANLGRYEEALSAYEEAIRLKPDEAAWLGKGNQLANLGRYEEALSAYEEAIRLKPDEAAWHNKGNQLANLGRYEEALSAYEEAIRLKPDYDYAWNGKGNQLANLGRYEEALSAYEEAIRLKPDYETAWFCKGSQLGNLERYEEAIAAYDEAIKLKADYIEAIFNKAMLLKELGHQDIANQQFHLIVETCQQYKNKDNQTIDFWNVYAASLTCLGQYEEVEQILQKALAINPNHPNTNYNLACYYAIQDNIPLAVEYLAKAIQLRPSDREQAKKDSDFDKIRQDPRFIELISDNF